MTLTGVRYNIHDQPFDGDYDDWQSSFVDAMQSAMKWRNTAKRGDRLRLDGFLDTYNVSTKLWVTDVSRILCSLTLDEKLEFAEEPPKTTEYSVSWTIELDAETPRKAAEEALHAVLYSDARVFQVRRFKDKSDKGVEIDLDDSE